MEPQVLRCFADPAQKSSIRPREMPILNEFHWMKSSGFSKPSYSPIANAGTTLNLIEEPSYLENPWSFWFDKYPGPGLSVEQYAAALKKLGTVNTIQNFWMWFNNLPQVDQLKPKQCYHLMKDGIRPLWEDVSNLDGGSLSVKIRKEDANYVYQQVVLAVVGEQLSSILNEADDICGITLSVRNNENMLVIWNKAANLMNQKQIESYLTRLLPKARFQIVGYKAHKAEENLRL